MAGQTHGFIEVETINSQLINRLLYSRSLSTLHHSNADMGVKGVMGAQELFGIKIALVKSRRPQGIISLHGIYCTDEY